MATLIFGTTYGLKEIDLPDNPVNFYLERKEKIEKVGKCKVKFLFPCNVPNSQYSKIVDKLKKHDEGSLIELPYKRNNIEDYLQVINWPRDAFQIFGKTVLIPEQYEHDTKRLLQELDIRLEIKVSDLGEGGLSIRLNKLVLCADLDGYEWNELKQYDFHPFRLSLPNIRAKDSRERNLAKKLISEYGNPHIDTHLNLAMSDKGIFLCVTKPYYEVFKSKMHQIADSLEAEMYIIKNTKEIDCCAVNFIQLPNNSIIIPEDSYNTIRFISKYLDENKIIALPTLPGECSKGYGLRCRTNLVP